MDEKKKNKKHIAEIITIALVVVAILAVFFVVVRIKNNGEKKPANQTEAEKILERDLDRNYPFTPREVMKLYCRVLKCIQNEELTDSEITDLVIFQRQMFDDEFLAANPEGQYVASVAQSRLDARKIPSTMTSYKVELDSGVDKWTAKDGEFAKLVVYFSMKNANSYESFYQEYLLRKDDKGRYKIVGWKQSDGAGAIME